MRIYSVQLRLTRVNTTVFIAKSLNAILSSYSLNLAVDNIAIFNSNYHYHHLHHHHHHHINEIIIRQIIYIHLSISL